MLRLLECYLSLSFVYLDRDFILLFDFDFFISPFLVKYCLLKDNVFCELDLFNCDFLLVFYLLVLTILPS